jgi:hypothetical protein
MEKKEKENCMFLQKTIVILLENLYQSIFSDQINMFEHIYKLFKEIYF